MNVFSFYVLSMCIGVMVMSDMYLENSLGDRMTHCGTLVLNWGCDHVCLLM